MKKVTRADGTLAYKPNRIALIVMSAGALAALGLLSPGIPGGQLPNSALYGVLFLGAVFALLFGFLWWFHIKNTLKISADRVAWGAHNIDIADIESVRVDEETVRAGFIEGDEPVLVFSVRGAGEVRTSELARTIDSPNKETLLDAKAEIEKRIALIAKRRKDGDDGAAVDEG